MLVPRSAFAARKICDSNSSRYALGGVQFSRELSESVYAGRPWAAATDGRRLVALSWIEDEPNDFPACGFDVKPKHDGVSVLIPAAICAEAAKAKPGLKSRLPILRNIALGEHDAASVPLVATDVESVQRIDARQDSEARFPRWHDCIPSGRDEIHFKLNAKYLRDLLEVIESHTGESGVVISLDANKPHESIIVLTTESPDGNRAIGALMPLSFGDPRNPSPPARAFKEVPTPYSEAAAAAKARAAAYKAAKDSEAAAVAPEVIAVDLEPEAEEVAEVAATIEPEAPAAELPPPPREDKPTKAPGKVKLRRSQDWRESARAVSLAAFV